MIGEVLGNRYELIEKIGEGGMAIVYKARDNKLNRMVAIKVLKKEFANNKDIADKFKKEAMAVANLSDANIVNVLDVGHEEEGNVDYFVMEYVNGKTLKELIVFNGKLSYGTTINIAIQIAKALECAHLNNIIHRDVKPQNILVTESGLVKVTDFGIAKSSTSATITNTTTIMGSAHYLSPEQAKGSFIDGRSDIYSLGIVLYEMVTGSLPFDGESPVTIALKHIQSEAVDPKSLNSSIPDSLNTLIVKCISKECINRYESCNELINDLQKIKDNPNVNIGAKNNLDDSKTIIMEPIRSQILQEMNNKNNNENKIYSKTDFEEEFNNEDEDDDDDELFKFNRNKKNIEKKTKTKSKTPIIIGVVIVLLLVIGGISSAFLLGGGSKEVVVPNIIDMTVEEAIKELEKVNLKLKISDRKESDKEEDTILESNPKVDAKVSEGTVIEVVVSGGQEKVVVPDLRDYEVNYIKDLLTQKGLQYEITEENSDNVKSGYLIKQSPEKDEEVPLGTVIYLTISKGPAVKLVTVENYLGLNVSDAKAQLEQLNLVVELKERETDRETEDGIVLEQSPQGTRVEEGTPIVLYYGKYIEPTIDISQYLSVGMSLVDAINTLNMNSISYTISGGTPQESDMSMYTVKGFTNTIKKGEIVKIQVEKIENTVPPVEEDEGEANPTGAEE